MVNAVCQQENMQPNFNSNVVNAVCQQLLKALKVQQASSSIGDQANNSFAGNTFVGSSFKALSNSVMLKSIS